MKELENEMTVLKDLTFEEEVEVKKLKIYLILTLPKQDPDLT